MRKNHGSATSYSLSCLEYELETLSWGSDVDPCGKAQGNNKNTNPDIFGVC